MKNVLYAIIVLVCILISDACQKAVSYPAEPQISLKSYEFTNAIDTTTKTTGKLLTVTLNFTDGDGDLFSLFKDTVSQRSKIHLTFYKKENGIFVLVPDSFWHTPYNFTLPYESVMDRNGQNKTQKGTIEFSNYFLPGFPFDTVKVGCTIMDMAFNKSNEVILPDTLIFTK